MLDRTDTLILNALQEDGRISNVRLAERVNLSESACLRRVKALEDDGLIERYVGLVNAQAAGLPGNIFVQIVLQREDGDELEAFEAAVTQVPEVLECFLMTGEFDYLLRVVAKDMGDFERIHRDYLTRLPGVARVHSSVALRTVLRKTALPLQQPSK